MDKRLGVWIVDRIEIIQFLHFGLVAVAEIADELADMIGDDIFGMFFSVATQVEQLHDFVHFITVGLQGVMVASENMFVGQRMGGLDLYVGQISCRKFPLRFQFDRFIESQVKNFGAGGPGRGVFDQRGGFAGAGHGVDPDVSRGMDNSLLFVC